MPEAGTTHIEPLIARCGVQTGAMRFGHSAMPSRRTFPPISKVTVMAMSGLGRAALCADTKLICTWKIGTRGASTAYALMHDLVEAPPPESSGE